MSVGDVPDDLRYAKSHEWARHEGNTVTVGITDHAQDALNDIVYVEFPSVGDVLEQGQQFGTVESVKSVSDLYSPVSGKVVAVNGALEDAPEAVNESPYGEGWLIKVEPSDPSELENLLDADGYRQTLS